MMSLTIFCCTWILTTGDRCQYETLNTEYNETNPCPDEVCSGTDAYCAPLLKGGFACNIGENTRCEETDTHTDKCNLRTASFVPGSYLMFPRSEERRVGKERSSRWSP